MPETLKTMSEQEEEVCDGRGSVALRSQSRLANAADIIIITIIIIINKRHSESILRRKRLFRS